MGTLYDSLPSLLAATVAFAVGTSVVLRDRNRDEFVLFGVFCFNLGLFHLARFFDGFTGVELFGWAAQTLSLLLPWAADRCFTSLFPADRPKRYGPVRTAVLVTLLVAQSIALLVLLEFGPFASWAQEAAIWSLVRIGLGGYVIFGLLGVAMRMWRAARKAEGTAAAPRMRYLFYASIGVLALGSPLIPAIGPIVTAVYLYFVAQTLLRERLLELPEVVAKIATLALLVVCVTGLFSILVLWVPRQANNSTALFVFNVAVASYAVIVLIDPVRAEFESRIENWLFRDRTALREMMIQLRFRLLNVIDVADMVDATLSALRESNRVTQAAIYTLDAAGTHLVLRGDLGGSPIPRIDLARRRPLVERLQASGSLLRDVVQRDRDRGSPDERAELDDVLATFAEVGASLAVPILAPAGERDGETLELLGALFVDDERLLEPFAREEVELFESVAAQAAVTLQNSAVYERRKERDRLAALGEMAAGLAHEIRNPLGAIKGATQLVQPSVAASDPATAEFLDVIVEEVDRLNRVVQQFLRYSRPFTGEMKPVAVPDIVQATVRLLPPERAGMVTIDVPDSLPRVRGDGDALRQVLHNLVLNALDAVGEIPASESFPGRGHVWIEARLRVRGLPTGDAVAISVRDDGPGIAPSSISNLFVPFHTTKTGGTGLGLPISQRIVENHRGVIEVGNAASGGAIFTVLLPADPPPPSGLTT